MVKERMKKVTVMLPEDLLRRAQRATRDGITPTLRKGLERLATDEVYEQLRKLRGKVKFGMTWQELRGEE